MVLTRKEELLIDGLMMFNVKKEEIMGIMLLLDTAEKQDLMLEYMKNNKTASERELMRKALQITHS